MATHNWSQVHPNKCKDGLGPTRGSYVLRVRYFHYTRAMGPEPLSAS